MNDEEKPDENLKDLSNIKKEDIDDQIKIRQYLIGIMVGNLYPRVLENEIVKLKVMKRFPVDTKVEGGFLYYKLKDKWQMAGRECHPLTEKFLKQITNQHYNNPEDT